MQQPVDLSGRILGGRYRIVRLLGAGGMGAVYEAVQEGLGRKVALKVLHGSLAWDPEQIERFRREAQAAGAIGHPNIVQVTDFSATPGEPPFLVMELLSGRSLGQTITSEGALAPGRVAHIASQALHALGAAHRAGIVHRDIKPDNLFLTSLASHTDVVKLLDFGVAKLQEAAGKLTATGAMIGTPAYMAPEQARGAEVDARADLYAVGACMFHALSGRLPFEATSAPALLYAILEQTPPELSSMRADVPAGLSQVIARALSKQPDARFGSADEMRAAIEPYVAGNHQTATPSIATSHAGTAPRMSFDATMAAQAARPAASTGLPTWIWIVGGLSLLAAFGVVAIAGGAMFLLRSPPPEPVAISSSTPPPAPTAGAVAPVTTGAEIIAEKPAPRASVTPSVIPPRTVTPTSTDAGTASVASTSTVAPKPTARKTAHMTSIVAGQLFSLDQVRTAINNPTVQGQVNACYAASEMDPVDHQFVMWQLVTKPSGDVASVGPIPGSTAERSPKLDVCMGRVLGSVHFGAPNKPEPSEVRVGFAAELPFKN